MPTVLVNKTSLPITAQDSDKRNITIGPGNAYTTTDGRAANILANASIAGFRIAQTMDGWEQPRS